MAIPAGIGTQTGTTIRLDDGTDTIVLRPALLSAADPIVTRDHSLTMAAPRVVQQARAGRNGVNDLTEYHDEATFQANLIVRDEPAITRHQHVDRLRAMLRADRRPWLYLQRAGWLTERRARVRGGSLTSPIDRAAASRLETSLQIVIPDGVLESPNESSDTIRPGSAAAGLAFPVVFPVAWSPYSSGATKLVAAGGGEYGAVSTPLLMRLYGACTDPIISNQTTGQVFELDGLTLTAGQYLEIDMDAQTVLLNGDPNNSYYSKINFATSSWWELQPGMNLLSLGAATSDASCELDLTWHDRFAI